MLIRPARRTVLAGRLLRLVLIALMSVSAIALHQLSHQQHGLASVAPAAWNQVAVSHPTSTAHVVSSGSAVNIGHRSDAGEGSGLSGRSVPIVEAGSIAEAELAAICEESCQPVAALSICLMAFVLLGRRLRLRLRALLHWAQCWVWRAARDFGVAGRWTRVRLWWPEVSAQLLGISRT